jgi:hypothetical protein
MLGSSADGMTMGVCAGNVVELGWKVPEGAPVGSTLGWIVGVIVALKLGTSVEGRTLGSCDGSIVEGNEVGSMVG